ncbi:MAG: asparagine synthase-related protein [Flavobacteriales bacterium]
MIYYYGVFDLQGQNNIGGDIDAMNASVSPFDFKEIDHWWESNIFLAQKYFAVTPEAMGESLPLHHPDYNLTLVGEIRLDNRQELFSLLNIPARLVSDAQLVLEAYWRWKENCAAYLLGDFAFAIYDATAQRIVCCRDHFGTRSFLYFYNGKKFVFSSRSTHILPAEGVDGGINKTKLASMIYMPVKNSCWEEDWCENILLLPAGTTMIVDKEGLRKKKYWTPSPGKELKFKNEAEYAEAFRAIFFKAVEDRLRSSYPVSALLSGGLDSSSIVAVAAKILEKQNKTLHTYSVVLPDPQDKTLKDERFYIDQFKSFPNIEINYVTAPGKGFFSDMHVLEQEVVPPILNSRHFLYDAFAEELRKKGSQVLLDGSGGEMGASMYGDGVYPEMLLKGRWLGLLRELNARKKLTEKTLQRIFLGEVIRPFIKTQKTYKFDLDNHCLHADVIPELLDIINKTEITNPAILSAFPKKNHLEILKSIQVKAQGTYSYREIDFRFPLKDKRLLEFCLNVPSHFKMKNGYHRYLVRAGLEGILPAEIQWRTSKMAMDTAYNRRFKAQLSEVRDFLNSIKANDPVRRIVDIEKIKSWTDISLRDEEMGTPSARIALGSLPSAIYLIYFLRHFKEFKNV